MSEDKSPTRHSHAVSRSDGGIQTSVIYCGDCLDELKRLPDNCIDLVTVKQLIDRDFRKELEYIRMLGGG